MRQLRYRHVAVFLLLITAYVGLRLWRLTDACLWFDEIFSVHAAEHAWSKIWNFVALDLIHPPLFYVLLKIWIAVGGESLLWLRLFSVIFSTLALFPFISFCRELKIGRWTTALALFLFVGNGSLIKYAQEVRMYSMLMCFSLFSIWLFARFFIKGKSFVPLVIINVLLVWTHYFGWFVTISEVVLMLCFQRIKWRRITLMFAITLVSFVPWMIAVIKAANSGSSLSQNIGWMTRPGFREIGTLVLNFVEPIYNQTSSAEPVSIFYVSVPVLLIVIAGWIFYIARWQQHSDRSRRNIFLLAVFIKLPIIIVLISSWLFPYSVWGTRHLIIVFAPFAILTAIAVANIPLRWLQISFVSLLILFCGYASVMNIYSRQNNSWCGVEPLVTEALESEKLNIYTTEDLFAYHAWFTGQQQLNKSAKVFKIDHLDGLKEDSAFFLPRGFADVKTIDFTEITDKKLWLIYRSGGYLENEPPIRNFNVADYKVVKNKSVVMKDASAILVLLEK